MFLILQPEKTGGRCRLYTPHTKVSVAALWSYGAVPVGRVGKGQNLFHVLPLLLFYNVLRTVMFLTPLPTPYFILKRNKLGKGLG